MKKVLKVSRKVSIGAAVTAVGIATAGFFWLTSGSGKPVHVPTYGVIRVIDGDTFETEEHQHIRLASNEAPELDRCGGPEAKAALEKLVLKKPVYLKVVFRDPYQRLVSFVYTQEGFINEVMLLKGYSYYARSSPGEIGEALSAASNKARGNKKGIFGSSCTQGTNLKNTACNIKGNDISKIYYVPGCGNYNHVDVQLYLGDQWFCSEKEATDAEFRKPKQCS